MSINFRKELAMGRALQQANATQMGAEPAPMNGMGKGPTAPTRTPVAKRYPKVQANAMNPNINTSPEPV
jgi:hypothetical protein